MPLVQLTLLQPGGQIMPTTLLLAQPDLKTQRHLWIDKNIPIIHIQIGPDSSTIYYKYITRTTFWQFFPSHLLYLIIGRTNQCRFHSYLARWVTTHYQGRQNWRGRSVNPIITRGQSVPTTLLLAPRIFIPSAGSDYCTASPNKTSWPVLCCDGVSSSA